MIVAAIEESRCDNCDEGASVELHSTNTVQSAIMKSVCTAGYGIFGRFLAGEVCIKEDGDLYDEFKPGFQLTRNLGNKIHIITLISATICVSRKAPNLSS